MCYNSKFMTKSKKIPQFITEENFFHLIKCYLSNSKKKINPLRFFSRIRNCIIWMIQFYMGLRPKEAKDIRLREIDLKKGLLYIPAENNKQRNQDVMPIQEFLIHKIKSYLKIRNRFFPHSPFLFPSTYNSEKPVYHGTLIRAFTMALTMSGFGKVSYIDEIGRKKLNLSLYSLRHSFGTFAMHSLKDNKQVAKLLRHYDPQCRSTFIYTHTEQSLTRKQLLDKIKFNP